LHFSNAIADYRCNGTRQTHSLVYRVLLLSTRETDYLRLSLRPSDVVIVLVERIVKVFFLQLLGTQMHLQNFEGQGSNPINRVGEYNGVGKIYVSRLKLAIISVAGQDRCIVTTDD